MDGAGHRMQVEWRMMYYCRCFTILGHQLLHVRVDYDHEILNHILINSEKNVEMASYLSIIATMKAEMLPPID